MEAKEMNTLKLNEKVKTTSCLYWNDLFKLVLRAFTSENAESLCRFLLLRLEECGCESRFLVDRVLTLHSIFLRETLIREGSVLIGHFGEFEQFSYEFTYASDVDVYNKHIALVANDLFLLATEAPGSKFASLLVRYGLFKIDEEKISSTEETYRHQSLVKFWMHVYQHVIRGSENVNFMDFNKIIVMISEVEDNGLYSKNARGTRRTLVLIMMLRGIILKQRQDPDVREFVQCMRMYFAVSRQPFVTSWEMAEFLDWFKNEVPAEVLELLVNDYKELFFESDRPFAPRPLKHLSRCVIRECIYTKSDILSERLQTLNVPKRLQDYILCEPEYYL